MHTIRAYASAVFILFLMGCAGVSAADALRVITTYHETRYNCVEDGFWAVRIRFNRSVVPADLAESLTVTADGEEESFRIYDPNAEDTLASRAERELRIAPEKGRAKAGLIKIVVKSGLQDASGKRVLDKDHTYQFRCGAHRIYVANFATYYASPRDRGVTLTFSDEIDADDVKKLLKITPAVKNITITGLEHGRRYRITADFDFQREYVLEIPETKIRKGKAIISGARFPFKGPGVTPRVAVKTKRSVIELRSRQLLPVSIENVTAMRVELDRIAPFLVPEVAAKSGKKNDLKHWPNKEQASAVNALVKSGKLPASLGGEFTRDADVFLAPEAKDRVYGYSVPLSFRKKPEIGGAWALRLSDPDRPGVEDSRLVQITDLSVSYKVSAHTLLIWVTSIYSGEPVPGVDVLLAAQDNRRFLAGKTDAQGIVAVKDGRELPTIGIGKETSAPAKSAVEVRSVQWVVAATATDACAAQISEDRLKPFAIKQTETADAGPTAVKGSVFTERGIYRPGETVFFKCTVREYEAERIGAAAGRRVKLTITDSRSEVQYAKDLTLGEFGTCHDSFQTKGFGPSGTYTLSAETSSGNNEKTTFSTTFLVQQYKPPRHYVTVSAKQASGRSEEYIALKKRVDFLDVEANAQYYTGGPVKYARARWKATLVPVEQQVEGLEGFFFGNADDEERFLESGESLLDKNGTLKLAVPLDPRLLTGLYGVQVSVTVLDVDGEPATNTTTFKPQPRFRVGISRHPARVQDGYSATLKLVVVDSEGKKVQTGQVTASQLTKSSFYTQKRDENGNINYLWEYGWLTSTSSRVPLSEGEGQYEVELNEYGSYMLSFTFEDKTGNYSSQTIFKVGWEEYDDWLRRDEEKEVRTFNEVLPALSKKEYRVGETVTVEFNTRRPVRKCLVAVEAGDVLDYRVVEAKGKRITHRFKALPNHRPNVYVSLLAATGRTDFPVYQSQTDTDIPSVFFGYADVRVRTDVKTLSVAIAPRIGELKGRPGEETELTFKVVDDRRQGVVAELAVCVVDEAVLALTNYQTPDLSSLTDFQRLLSVFSGDLRLSLVSQDLFRVLSTRPLKGGGMGEGFVGPSVRKDFRPVAYFNPALVTDPSGEARIKFQLPDSTTAYRVYAVACDKTEGFASNERKMVVTKEFFVEPSLTRFLIPGDRLTFPLVLNNKTAGAGEASVGGEASTGLQLELPQATITLDPYSSSVLRPSVFVAAGVSSGTLRFQGSFKGAAGTFSDAIENTVPVHSRHLPVSRVAVGSFSRHAEIRMALPEALKALKADEIHPGEFKAYLSLSTSNWNRIAPGLKYLLHYPFGCVEQTSSGMIPLAALRALIKQGALPGITTEQVDQFLERGVTRVLSMQRTDGAFSYWPGRSEVSWWGTQYAIFALIQARGAGYPVPEDRLKLALSYVQRTLIREAAADAFKGESWAKYLALFNLSFGEMLTSSELQPFLENYDSLDDQAKAFLMLAATNVGALPRNEIAERIGKLGQALDPGQHDYYDSSFRTAAVCLMASVEANAAPEKAAYWAGYLLKHLRPEGRWYSTADTGWCLLSLAAYLKGKEPPEGQTIPCRIHVGAQKPIEFAVSAASTDVELDPYKLLAAGKVSVEATRQGLVNYTLSVVYPDVERDPAKLSDGFSLRKTVENLNGREEIRVGDVVRITLEIEVGQSPRGRNGYLEYVALEDPVPAGLVPISSELATEGVMREEAETGEQSPWRDGYYDMEPTYRELRDDGVRVFKDRAWTGSYRFTYLARAVAEGDFWMRGSRISLMYNPDVYGKTVGRRVRILPAE